MFQQCHNLPDDWVIAQPWHTVMMDSGLNESSNGVPLRGITSTKACISSEPTIQQLRLGLGPYKIKVEALMASPPCKIKTVAIKH
jgi:hypothetical protein